MKRKIKYAHGLDEETLLELQKLSNLNLERACVVLTLAKYNPGAYVHKQRVKTRALIINRGCGKYEITPQARDFLTSKRAQADLS